MSFFFGYPDTGKFYDTGTVDDYKVTVAPNVFASLAADHVNRPYPDPREEPRILGMKVEVSPYLKPDQIVFRNGSKILVTTADEKITGFGTPTGKSTWVPSIDLLEAGLISKEECMRQLGFNVPDRDIHYRPVAGWEMVPERLRHFPPSKFLFGFRQHLGFLLDCIDNVPYLHVIIISPDYRIQRVVVERSFYEEAAIRFDMDHVVERRSAGVCEFTNGACIRFMTSEDPHHFDGYHPDYFIVKELTREDW